MKLINNKVLLVMMLIFANITVQSAPTTPIIQSEQQTLVVGSEQNFPPFATGMTDSTASGFTVDLWKAVAAEANLKYMIRVMPFRQVLENFKKDKIDVLINLAISDERDEFADFSVPHVIVKGAIFVRNYTNGIQSEDDLSEKSIIVLNADLAHDYAISKGWAKQLILVDTVSKGFQLLASGKHDVMLVSKLVGMQTLQHLDLTNIKALDAPVGFSQKFAFAVHHGQTELLSQINEALAITKANGIYTTLYDKWFGVYETKKITPSLIFLYLSPFIILFSILSGYFYYLRHVERKHSEEKLKLAASVFSHAREAITITDADGNIVDVNDTFTQTTGYSREEVIGENPRILQSGRQPSKFYTEMWQDLLEKGYWYGEMWNRRKNGEVYAEMKTISAVRNKQGITTHYVALCSDITKKQEHQQQLEHIAHYDILTNLPNRALLADRLSQAMLQCGRHNTSLAVGFLDLDGFKEVNDTYGHDVGDELLIAISHRMKAGLREGDTLARFGGDEFVVILADLVKIEDCEPLLKRLLLAASEPVSFGDKILSITASIGATIYPHDSVDNEQLMRHADQAMYLAKQYGKNRYYLFDTAQADMVKHQREYIAAIRNALDSHQFILHYQPKVNMRTGHVIGVEALIRWQHPERGLLNPNDFLPVIENDPLIIELGEWVIDSALTQLSHWQDIGLKFPVGISVNIAAKQLQQANFTDRLATLLASHSNVKPHYLELEVLETNALGNVVHVSEIMEACITLGVKFAIDDFGTGYSSLTYLRRLPTNLIKIDQSFVRDMLEDPDDLAIVEGVISLARSFKLDVIAEGVETIEHGSALLKLGCELAQGYGIAKPMLANDIPAWVNEWKPDEAWK